MKNKNDEAPVQTCFIIIIVIYYHLLNLQGGALFNGDVNSDVQLKNFCQCFEKSITQICNILIIFFFQNESGSSSRRSFLRIIDENTPYSREILIFYSSKFPDNTSKNNFNMFNICLFLPISCLPNRS